MREAERLGQEAMVMTGEDRDGEAVSICAQHRQV